MSLRNRHLPSLHGFDDSISVNKDGDFIRKYALQYEV